MSGSETITYTVTVKRMSLESIEILKYKNDEITFRDSEGSQTTLDKEEFKNQYPDEWKKIENGDYKFDEDGEIVKDEEKEDKEEKETKKKSNTVLIVVLIVVGLAIIGISGFLIFRKKKPTKKDGEEKDPNNENSKDEEDINEEGMEEDAIENEEKR